MRILLAFALMVSPAMAGEIVRLTSENWKLVPGGKEVDAIYGDYLLRNDKVVAVIGDTVPGRNANMSCKSVQGAVIDFTLLATNNDQLSVFYPHGDRNNTVPQATRAEILTASGPVIVLRVVRPATDKEPVEAVTDYSLKDGETALRVTTRYRNTGGGPAVLRVSDKMRCDQTFSQSPEGAVDVVTFYDKWFGAAYAVVRPEGKIYTDGKYGGMFGSISGTWLDYPEWVRDSKTRTTILPAGAEIVLTRFLVTGRHQGEVQASAREILGAKSEPLEVSVVDTGGAPVAGADVVLIQGLREVSAGSTDERGQVRFSTSGGRYTVEVSQIGRLKRVSSATPATDPLLRVEVGPRSAVWFDVSDGAGRSIPCKAQFLPVDETPPISLGPKQRANGCANLYFSPSGRFTVPLPPGKYYIILSHGPEYDAAYRSVALKEGETIRVSADLPRVVNSAGWISADFHNHSTESGDNTTETESRLICLAAEGVEFAASTEHNRIVTYRDRLRALGLDKQLATSDGMELTASPLPIMHHNAFPLVEKPHLQDGGGPITGPAPLDQIRRLYDHDAGAEKLVQQNHPDIGWLFYDADGDGVPDLGFGTYKFTHVIEAWAPGILDMKPLRSFGIEVRNNVVFNWLQLLNQGFRIPGVANTDAHYCVHESGRARNYVKSPTDDPAAIQELDVVRESKKGHLVMTNGPFLDVSLNGALPGDDLRLDGPANLRIRVECPNWIDVDRVQVLVNGRPDPRLNFTKAAHPAMFHRGPVIFREEIALELKGDAHVIVAAVGEHSTMGPVMGPDTEAPCAVSNPIYVDVDGGGFTPNKDTLDAPLPVKKSATR
ncbi:MAG TPA: CehA/McbA family metallohydrolase [Planctomycetota bacterium]|nr:CehA/McbA family metallohydrolase [Planctomycetota bacterium]